MSEAASLLAGQNGIGLVVPLLYFGTEEQRLRFYPEVAKGRTLVAVAITEPHAGSDPGAMKTFAKRDGNSAYVLNGQKCFITFGPVADYITVFAKTSEGYGTDKISAFVVEKSDPGVSAAIAARLARVIRCTG